MRRTISLAALLALVILVVSITGRALGADWKSTLALAFKVQPETTYQTVAGFGAGFDENTNYVMQQIASAQDRAKAYDLLYGGAGARLNIIRLTISPLAQPIPATSFVGYDWANEKETQSEWKAIKPILQPGIKSQPQGAAQPLTTKKHILYAVPFTPPAQWKDNGVLEWGGSLSQKHYQNYAAYLVSFLMYYHTLGYDIDVISVQNEPEIVAPWRSCIWSGDQLRKFVQILAPAIQARGLKTKIMLSEGTNWTNARDNITPALSDPASSALVDVMASHSYKQFPFDPSSDPFSDPGRAWFKQTSQKNGKPVWMSEMSLMQPPQNDDPTMTAALKVARYIHLDMTEARASAWIYSFAIFWTIPPGMTQQLGSMGVLSPPDGPANGALVVPKRLWAIANYSRFARPGWKVIAVDSGPAIKNTGFINPNAHDFAIVAINSGDLPRNVHYDFGGKAVGGLKAYATTDTLDLGQTTTPNADPNGFGAVLQPRSVTTFTGTLGP
jgi:glucuronoarabinoxylan endo-1,4-beta-xylanase